MGARCTGRNPAGWRGPGRAGSDPVSATLARGGQVFGVAEASEVLVAVDPGDRAVVGVESLGSVLVGTDELAVVEPCVVGLAFFAWGVVVVWCWAGPGRSGRAEQLLGLRNLLCHGLDVRLEGGEVLLLQRRERVGVVRLCRARGTRPPPPARSRSMSSRSRLGADTVARSTSESTDESEESIFTFFPSTATTYCRFGCGFVVDATYSGRRYTMEFGDRDHQRLPEEHLGPLLVEQRDVR